MALWLAVSLLGCGVAVVSVWLLCCAVVVVCCVCVCVCVSVVEFVLCGGMCVRFVCYGVLLWCHADRCVLCCLV